MMYTDEPNLEKLAADVRRLIASASRRYVSPAIRGDGPNGSVPLHIVQRRGREFALRPGGNQGYILSGLSIGQLSHMFCMTEHGSYGSRLRQARRGSKR